MPEINAVCSCGELLALTNADEVRWQLVCPFFFRDGGHRQVNLSRDDSLRDDFDRASVAAAHSFEGKRVRQSVEATDGHPAQRGVREAQTRVTFEVAQMYTKSTQLIARFNAWRTSPQPAAFAAE